ncbi:MAG: type II toxin-antitoxin system HicB family antitoxin, partial [Candidatus Deferrimicrobiota bacterium]
QDDFGPSAREERLEEGNIGSTPEARRVEMKIEYPLKIHKAEEGGYWAEFPDLPGCITEGDSEVEVLSMAKDALSGWLAVRFERNFAIPEAKFLKGKNVRWVEPNPDVGIPLMIRKIRNELGLSQKEVAHRLHIAYQSYQAWENPKIANPTLKQLSKLAGAVGKKLTIEMV